MIAIADTSYGRESEALAAPFAFKGHALTELWQPVACLDSAAGRRGVGVGTQSSLWSDASIFLDHDEDGANELMFGITVEALKRAKGRQFTHPSELINSLFPEMLEFARSLIGKEELRPTFVLNALVPVDHAAWQLHAQVQGSAETIRLLENEAELSEEHAVIADTPALGYGDSIEKAARFARAGAPVLKVKLGYDPVGAEDKSDIVAWDCERLSSLNVALKGIECEHTTNGSTCLYLDLNGRYNSIEMLRTLVEHCDSIKALENICLIEEPFHEYSEFDVSEFPVCIAADESAHSVSDLNRLLDVGYGAIALKPAAKSFSISIAMADAARKQGTHAFCADLTANPTLVDWARNLAARLPTLPQLKVAILETNGAQNYRDWERMTSYHPSPDAPWVRPHDFVYTLPPVFFEEWGGFLSPSAHYSSVADQG